MFNNLKSVYCGYSTDSIQRYMATSGGVGSCLLKYLFDTGYINSALSFRWSCVKNEYEPHIIDSFENYKSVGSIYHDINLVQYLKRNVNQIKSPFFCFALPCQTRAIKKIMDDAGIDIYIAQLTCSSQQSIDATHYLLKRKAICMDDISIIKYRGNGWPSGVQILTKDGASHFVPNNNSLWMDIFHSRLFIKSRCRSCNPDLPIVADIVLADPWRIDTLEKETKGRTLFAIFSDRLQTIIQKMSSAGLLSIEQICYDKFFFSQEHTIKLKRAMLSRNFLVRIYKRIVYSDLYKKIVLSSTFLFQCHCSINNFIKKIFVRLFS